MELEDAGLAQPYHAAMAQAAATFEAIAVDYPHEAQYVVPMAYRIRWAMHINLRALLWLVELRSSQRPARCPRPGAVVRRPLLLLLLQAPRSLPPLVAAPVAGAPAAEEPAPRRRV